MIECYRGDVVRLSGGGFGLVLSSKAMLATPRAHTVICRLEEGAKVDPLEITQVETGPLSHACDELGETPAGVFHLDRPEVIRRSDVIARVGTVTPKLGLQMDEAIRWALTTDYKKGM